MFYLEHKWNSFVHSTNVFWMSLCASSLLALRDPSRPDPGRPGTQPRACDGQPHLTPQSSLGRYSVPMSPNSRVHPSSPVTLMKHHPNIAGGAEKSPHGRLGTQNTDLLSKQFLTTSLWPLWWLWTTFSRIPFPVWFWARVGHMTQLAQDTEGGNEATAIISVSWRRPGCACRQLSDLFSP